MCSRVNWTLFSVLRLLLSQREICSHSQLNTETCSIQLKYYMHTSLHSVLSVRQSLSLFAWGRLLLLDTAWCFYWFTNTAACLLATDVSLWHTECSLCQHTVSSDMTKKKCMMWLMSHCQWHMDQTEFSLKHSHLHTDRQLLTIVIFTGWKHFQSTGELSFD